MRAVQVDRGEWRVYRAGVLLGGGATRRAALRAAWAVVAGRAA